MSDDGLVKVPVMARCSCLLCPALHPLSGLSLANLLRGFSNTFLKLSTGCVQHSKSKSQALKNQRGFRIASAWFRNHLNVVSESGALKKTREHFEIKKENLPQNLFNVYITENNKAFGQYRP